jgi:uncharacterized protein YggE
MKTISALILAAGVLAAAALAGVGLPEPAQSAPVDSENGITVTGTGTVTTVPNRAEFSFGVTSEGRTAAAALAANAAEMRRVIAALRGAGLASEDIQTQHVSLSPRYTNDGEAIVGYTASNTVSARIRDLARTGAVVDAAVEAGANQVFGPSLTHSDRNDLYRDALRSAYANARAKAQALAAAAGISLGRAVVVVEAGGPVPLPLAADAARVADTPIEPGTQEIQATVTVTFAVS